MQEKLEHRCRRIEVRDLTIAQRTHYFDESRSASQDLLSVCAKCHSFAGKDVAGYQRRLIQQESAHRMIDTRVRAAQIKDEAVRGRIAKGKENAPTELTEAEGAHRAKPATCTELR